MAKKSSSFSPKGYGEAIINANHIITDIDTDILYLYRDGYYDFKNSIICIEQMADRLLSAGVSDNKIKEIVSYVKRHTYRDISELKKNSYICLNNGLLNLDTLKLEQHTPKVFTTHKLDVDYDPDIDMTVWNWYIERLLPEADSRDTLQECCGNVFDVSNYNLKKLVWLLGGQNSGKSTFYYIFTNFLGRNNVSHLSVQELASTHENVEIVGMLANIRSEVPTKIRLRNAEIIKEFTGGDYTQFNPKHQKPYSAMSTAKLFYASNGLPAIDDVDNVFYGRIQLIEFNQKFEKNDRIKKEYTTPEMKSCMLNWLIEGYRRLKRNNWHLTKETDIDDVCALFQHATFSINVIADYILDRLEPCLTPENFIPKDLIYTDYKNWTKNKKQVAVSKKHFFKLLYEQKYIPITEYQPRIDGKQIYAIKGAMFKL